MLRLAIRTLRARKGGFLGAFLALFCAAALITACGGLLETGLHGRIATERYAATPAVVSADQNVHQTTVEHKKGEAKVKHKAKPLAGWTRTWRSGSSGSTAYGPRYPNSPSPPRPWHRAPTATRPRRTGTAGPPPR